MAVLLTAGAVDLCVVVVRWVAGVIVEGLPVTVVFVLRSVAVFCPVEEPVPVLYEVPSVDLRLIPLPLVVFLIFCVGCKVVLLSPTPVELPDCDLVFRVADVLA